MSHYTVIQQPLPALLPVVAWDWAVSDGSIILVRCGNEPLAQRICDMLNRDIEAAGVPGPMPCGNFASMTTDGRGCQRPAHHSGDCRPFHTADPVEWADIPVPTPPVLPAPTPEEQRRLLFANYMADDLNGLHTLLDALGAPKTKAVPPRDFSPQGHMTKVLLTATERLAAIQHRLPPTLSRQT